MAQKSTLQKLSESITEKISNVTRMGHCFSISSKVFSLIDVPDEILLKIFMSLPPKDLGRCLQVSKRFNQILKDVKLWQNIRIWNKFLRRKGISAKFFSQALDYGLENLSLRRCVVNGVLECRDKNQLKSLYLKRMNFYKRDNREFVSNVLENCQFLQQLFIQGFGSSKLDFQKITLNGHSLKVINISFHKFKVYWTQTSIALNLETVKLIVDNCTELSELALSNISQLAAVYLCHNLTPKICKLHLDCTLKSNGFYLPNNSVKILTKRCNKLTALGICYIRISNAAVRYIKNLANLEKLALCQSEEELTVRIHDFAEMSKLKLLCITSVYTFFGKKRQLKEMCIQQLSHMENLRVLFDGVKLVNFCYQKKLMDIAKPDKNRW